MTVDLRGTAYAASRMSSTLKGSTKQFGWLQASATRSYAAPTSCDYPSDLTVRPTAHRGRPALMLIQKMPLGTFRKCPRNSGND
jgi:hypothetical protein